MKGTYSTPKLITRQDLISATEAQMVIGSDGSASPPDKLNPAGSVGFQL